MAFEVIPFNVFMAIGPSTATLSAFDGGLVLIGGVSVSLLVLVALEKLGVPINETAVRWVTYGAMSMGFLALCWKYILFVI
jgi:hypothetical protein